MGDVASLRPRVIDGTSCQRGIRDICIDGLCKVSLWHASTERRVHKFNFVPKEVPCDLDLESKSEEDVCGVCNGDGTSCDTMTGIKELILEPDEDGKFNVK